MQQQRAMVLVVTVGVVMVLFAERGGQLHVVALEQEIEYSERSEWNTNNSLYGSFYSNLGA